MRRVWAAQLQAERCKSVTKACSISSRLHFSRAASCCSSAGIAGFTYAAAECRSAIFGCGAADTSRKGRTGVKDGDRRAQVGRATWGGRGRKFWKGW